MAAFKGDSTRGLSGVSVCLLDVSYEEEEEEDAAVSEKEEDNDEAAMPVLLGLIHLFEELKLIAAGTIRSCDNCEDEDDDRD